MTSMTHRKKLVAAGLAALVVGAAALLFAGGASASQWHEYKGDVFPGHAYGLRVPAQAASFEIAWSGEEGSAALALHDPTGARVGHYVLSSQLTGASVVAPAEGRWVLYVYELTGGALNVRVDAPAAPPLDLEELALARTDVAVATLEEPARLDKAFTTTLPATPVFVTLLYEGGVRAMDAKVSSAKGVVFTVDGETGTAFAPGVWSSLSGSRRMESANLDGASYTVEVHAESFEGTLYLSTLAVEPEPAVVEPPAKAPRPGKVPEAPASAPPAPALNASPAFEMQAGKAYAFEAKAGKLLVAPAAEDHDLDAVSVYAPNDTLVAYVLLDARHGDTTVSLPVDGEYVAYVHAWGNASVVARLANASAAPAVRELRLVEETFELGAGPLLAHAEEEITLARQPVALRFAPGENAFEVLSSASLENGNGVVASYSSFARMPGPFRLDGWTAMDPTAFAAGPHTFRADGVLAADLTLTAIGYDRGQVAVAETPATTEEAPGEAPAEETEAQETEPEGDEKHEKGFPFLPKDLFDLFG